MDKLEKYIDSDYLKQTTEYLKEVKELSYSLLNLKKARYILDIGCGPGIDTTAMAKLMSRNSHITGVDINEEMLNEANDLAKNLKLLKQVEHIKGSAGDLPFRNNYFDGVRADRLFQVIGEDEIPPSRIFDEAYRVLKKGGRMVLVDTDWGTASVDFSDNHIERKFLRFFTDHLRPNGYAGRMFYRLMKKAEMKDISVHPMPLVMRSFEKNNPLADWFYKEALKINFAPQEELDLWMDELTEKSEQGQFFGMVNMNVLGASK